MKKRLIWSFILFFILLNIISIIWSIGISQVLVYFSMDVPENPLGTKYVKKVVSHTKVVDGKVSVDQPILDYLKKQKVWIQILDENGTEIFSERRPEKIPTHYIPGQLVSYQRYGPNEIGYTLATWYEKVDKRDLTWVLGIAIKDGDNQVLTQELVNNMIIYNLIGWVILIFVIAFLFALRLGNPLLHIWKWLQQLSRGVYTEPIGRKDRPISLNRSGRLKRSFRVYREVIEALQRLTQTLKRNEAERAKLEKTREEWLIGVSHDLKTPLSTIKGYVDILAAKKYQVDEKEFDQILETVSQRIVYIEDLLADFSLTFQLKNNALPVDREPENIVELVREAVIDLINHPQAAFYEIQFEATVDEIIDLIDKKWYKRAIDNLLGNAFFHNPMGTKIMVTVAKLGEGYEIVITDDGKGMDEETQARLFERYFRGTHSGSASPGAGLGMAIAYQLIGLHGGKIKLHSALGKGTEIRIQFYRHRFNDGIPDTETGISQ